MDGESDTPRIMLAGHMDELGLMVKFITPEGFIKFQTIGGWLDQSLINQRWKILTKNGSISGVTGIKTVHVMEPEARQRVFKRQDMFIDVGATDQQDAESRLGIRPGDPIAPDSKFTVLNGEDLYLAKAWDDRIGVALVIEIMRTLKKKSIPNTVYGVATVQEEIGLRGAHTSSYQVAPDIGISLESGVASDYPGITKDEAQEKLGDGPSIFLHDNSMLPNLKLRDLFLNVAAENKIPLQFNVLSGYGEDGAEMQRTRGGAPSINIAVPTRYLHSHNGIINRRDFDYAVDLVSSVILKLDAKTVDYLKAFD
ncbi:MAG: endoglucanase [Chloroflexi bacterium]|jgi:endoglucanase|nr:MAG: endoglucanase [Chloroflexota bacterium]